MSDSNELAVDSVRGGTSLFLGVGVATVISGLGSIIIGRFLGPSNYALYSLALVLPTLLFSFSIFGIDVALVRYLPWFRERGENTEAISLLHTGLILRITIAIILMVFGVLFSEFFATLIILRPDLANLIRISSIAVAFEALVWVSFYSLQGINQMSWSGITRIFQAIAKAGLSIGLILIGFNVLGGIIGFTSGYAVSGVVSLLILLRTARDSSIQKTQTILSKRMIRLISRFGFPLYLVTIIAVITAQYRLVLLAMFSTDLVIGNFNAAVNIASILTGFASPLLMVLLPAFSKISARTSDSDLGRSFAVGQRYIAFFVVPSALVFMIFAQNIILLLYGPAFNLASFYLVLFTSIYLILALGTGVLESFFNGVGENRLTLRFWLLYLIIFIPLGYLFVIQEGVIGLILAELIARLISYIYGYLEGKKRLGINSDSRGVAGVFLSALIAGVIVAPIILMFESNMFLELLIALPLFLFVYLTMLPLTRAIHITDIELLEDAFSKMRGINRVTAPVLIYERAILSRLEGGTSE